MRETEKTIENLNTAKIILCYQQMLTPEMCIRIGQAITDAIALLKEQQELMFGMIVNSNAKCTDLGIHFRRLVLCKDCVRYEQETGCCKNKVVHGNAETWFCADGERR